MQNITVHNHVSTYVKPATSINQLFCNEPKLVGCSPSARLFYLPKEIWLKILVNYGVSARDLANLECSCKWFSTCCQGYSITDEAARVIIKRHKRKRFGELTNRVSGNTWRMKLHTLENLEANTSTLTAGSYQNACITKNREVVTWGAGKFGQLGSGQTEDCAQLQVISHLFGTTDNKVVQVSAGCGHTGFVTKQGRAFTCGDNRYNQLGHSNFEGKHCLVPTLVTDGELSSMRILQVACGSSHTLFLNDLGHVYAVGQGDSGQLGLGPHTRYSPQPTCIPLPYEEFNFIFIAAGIAHSVFLTECGNVFTFGLGSAGQLGHGGTKNLSTPALVTAVIHKVKITIAAASVCHTVLVDSKGGVYTCGSGRGILGHGDTNIRTVPKKVDSLADVPIASVAAGVGHTVFISKTGQGYWCGEGMGREKPVNATPTLMDIKEPLDAAAIGNSHIILATRQGNLLSTGKNGRHQTGHTTNNGRPVSGFKQIIM